MERTYTRARDRNYARRKATARQQDSTKMERFEKRIVIQCIAAFVVFVVLWGVRAIGGGFGEYMRNKVTYALTYTVDFHDIYSKTLKMGKDAAGLLIEKPDDDQPAAANQGAEDGSASTPATDVTPADGFVDNTADGSAPITTNETNPSTDGDDLLSD